mgnify:CR=1 FL=1
MKPVRVVVVDDHVLFRRGLVGLLAEMPDLQVVGEAGDGLSALQVVMETRPDVVLLDVNMPDMNGVETLRAFHKAQLDPRVLMLTISQQEEDLIGAILAGASGYLLKNAEPEVLHQTILQIAGGNSVLSPEVTAQVMNALRRAQGRSVHNLLSERELDVLRCLSRGLTTSQVAAELFVSENTVKTHIRHILKKMKVGNRVEAVAKGLQQGLI